MKLTLSQKTDTVLLLLHVFLIAFLFSNLNDFATPDSKHYLELSESLRNGFFGTVSTDGQYVQETLRLPGYPMFIMICQMLFGYSQNAVVLPQAFLYLVSVFLIYKSNVWNFGRLTGSIFLSFSLFYPVIAINSLHILPNLLSTFFVSAGIFSIAKPEWRKRMWPFVLCGFFFGLASYQRFNLFPLGFVCAVLIFIFFKEQRKHALVLVGVLCLIISPWLIRNYLIFENLLPGSNNVGLETMIYQNSLETRYAAEKGIFFRRNQFPQTYEEYESPAIQDQLKSIKLDLGLKGEDPYFDILNLPEDRLPEAKRLLRENAWKNARISGIHFVTIASATFVRMWAGKADDPPENIIYPPNFIGIGFGFLVLLFALAGLILLGFVKDDNAVFFGLLCAGAFVFLSLSLSFLHSEVRYAMPGKLLFLSLSAYSFGFLLLKIKTAWLDGGSRAKAGTSG